MLLQLFFVVVGVFFFKKVEDDTIHDMYQFVNSPFRFSNRNVDCRNARKVETREDARAVNEVHRRNPSESMLCNLSVETSPGPQV